MEKIFAVLGIILFIGGAFLFSSNKKEINWKTIGLTLFAELALAVVMLKTPVWKAIEVLSKGFSWVIAQSTEGINFVFGGITDNYVFFINSLLPIVFISALTGLLFHFNILQKFISMVGKFMAKFLKIDTLVAANGVTNMFLGQSDSLFVIKSYLPNAKDSVIFSTLVAGMSTISVSVMGLYVGFGASMEWILISVPLTMLSSIIMTQIIMPTKYSPEEIKIENDKGVNFIETMMSYGMTGFKGVIGISVALMVFLSLVYLINNLIGLFFTGVTLQSILGILFYPLSLLMGVPMNELQIVSEILATKLVTNEAVAFGLPQFAMLSANTKAMITVALCGFAGFGSIGIMIGGYTAVAPKKISVVAKMGVKALLIATIVNILTGSIIGLML